MESEVPKVNTKELLAEQKRQRAIDRENLIKQLDLSDEPKVWPSRRTGNLTMEQYAEFVKWYKSKHNLFEDLRQQFAKEVQFIRSIDSAEGKLENLMDIADRCYPDSHLFDDEVDDCPDEQECDD